MNADLGAPALRRGLALLRAIAARDGGATMAELAGTVTMPRATAYRLLRALVDEGFAAAAPDGAGRYVLGPAVDALRRDGKAPPRLEDVAAPIMDALAAELGETVKLVVRDGLEVVTLAVSIPSRDSCIASRVGTRLPLHVGASQRLLLAHAPIAVREAVLAGTLARFTPLTIVSPTRLKREMAAIATGRTFESHGEGVDGVGAAAALVGAGTEPCAALVSVYVYANRSATRRAAILRRTAGAADAITAALGDADGHAARGETSTGT